MAKRAKGLKVLKIIIILAITFLLGIIVTFCQKQSNPVVKDENVTTQTTSSKPKKHKKADTKKEKSNDTKVSVTITTPADETNSKDKKVVDENGLTPAEAEYYKENHLNPQPENDALLADDHYMGEFYSDDSESEPEYNADNDNETYYWSDPTGNHSSTATSSSQQTIAENNQSVDSNDQGGGNYGNN